MSYLNLKTEYSFRHTYGRIGRVLEAVPEDVPFAGICDRNSAFGHFKWQKACEAVGKKPLFGVEINVVTDPMVRTKQGGRPVSFIARNNAGLKEIYELIRLSSMDDHFYYFPRLGWEELWDVSEENVFMLSGPTPDWVAIPERPNMLISLAPSSMPDTVYQATDLGMSMVAASDNNYPFAEDADAYQVCIGDLKANRAVYPQHILDYYQWSAVWPGHYAAWKRQYSIAEACNASLSIAEMVKPHRPDTLLGMCKTGAEKLGVDLNDDVYAARLKRELDLIHDKGFEDYFYLIADIVAYAKTRMLVGPARGSSCGSLVCYLLGITTIDPIPYGLIFERFIDINRADLPDIDIDFADDRRDLVFKYLEEKYGEECVARLGTVSVFKPKSAIGEAAKELDVPQWEVEDFKNSIIERSSGDARAMQCILDTFNDTEKGRELLAKYPELAICADFEGHARHAGQHAAGVVVTQEPVTTYAALDSQTGAIQVDKKDAEALGLLKIDCLGLRTLTVIQDVLDQLHKERDWLYEIPLDDQAAFDVMNNSRWAGIFQFEGFALQSLVQQMHVDRFDDIVAITALARPGPLHSGAATEFVRCRTGQQKVVYPHPSLATVTGDTFGQFVYQEQIMQVGREIGDLSWEDVSALRKAMSKSLGKEFFDQYGDRFCEGAKRKHDIPEATSRPLWEAMCNYGSWSFNKSHAVAYGLLSYWCMYLKAHHPLEFSAACLRHAKDDEQCIKLLRELDAEGIAYKPVDPEHSVQNWSVANGVVVGGLIGIKGIGQKTADDIVLRRQEGRDLTKAQLNKLANPVTPWDNIFLTKEIYGDIYENPEDYNIVSKLTYLDQITAADEGKFVFIGRVTKINLRDHNETGNLAKRGYAIKGQSLFLNLIFEDDTSAIIAQINKNRYLKMGKPIVERGMVDRAFYLVKGTQRAGFRKIQITNIKYIGDDVSMSDEMAALQRKSD